MNPNNDLAWHGKGCVLIKLYEYELAIKSFTQAILLNSKCERAYIGWGLSLIGLEKWSEAIETLNVAIEMIPIQKYAIEAYHGKALALVNMNSHNEAITCFEKIFEINSDDEIAYFGIGTVFREM